MTVDRAALLTDDPELGLQAALAILATDVTVAAAVYAIRYRART